MSKVIRALRRATSATTPPGAVTANDGGNPCPSCNGGHRAGTPCPPPPTPRAAADDGPIGDR